MYLDYFAKYREFLANFKLIPPLSQAAAKPTTPIKTTLLHDTEVTFL